MDVLMARWLARILAWTSVAIVLLIASCILSGCGAVPTTECKMSWRGDCSQQLYQE